MYRLYLYLTFFFVVIFSLVGCRTKIVYKLIEYTLPVYELQNDKLTDQFAEICKENYAKMDQPDYFIVKYSQWEDTIFSESTGEILAIYNTVLRARVVHYDAMEEEDFCKSLLGCCKVGNYWIMTVDSVTLKNLFKATNREKTFDRVINNLKCYCVQEGVGCYIDADTIRCTTDNEEIFLWVDLDDPIFHFNDFSNPDSVATAYYKPKDEEYIYNGWISLFDVLPDSLTNCRFRFEDHVIFPPQAPDSINSYFSKFKLIVEKDGQISKIEFDSVLLYINEKKGKKKFCEPILCFSEEIQRVVATIPPLQPRFYRGKQTRYVISESCRFKRE